MARYIKITNVLTGLIAAFAATSCSTVPPVEMPNGHSRILINSKAAVIDDERQRAQERAIIESENAVRQQMAELNAEIAQLKEMIREKELAKAAPKEAGAITADPQTTVIQIKAAPIVAPAAKTAPEKEAATYSSTTPSGLFEVRSNSIIFRVSEALGKTEFNPSPAVSEELLKAAAAGKTIFIRGRTDAIKANPIDNGIALMRAYNARQFLIKNGVAADKIRLNYLAAGGNIADNSTSQGRALNRRAELQINGLDTTFFMAIKKITTVGSSDLPPWLFLGSYYY